MYVLKKELHGLNQSPRAWYDMLSNFLWEIGFEKGEVDTTLLVQIYLDDIIFGPTDESLCEEFSSIMEGEFEMSIMDKLNYFSGSQIKQNKNGVFINQSKYCK